MSATARGLGAKRIGEIVLGAELEGWGSSGFRDMTGIGSHIKDRNAYGSGVQMCGWGLGAENLEGG